MPTVLTCIGICLGAGWLFTLVAAGFYAYLAWFDPARYRAMVEPTLPAPGPIGRLIPFNLLTARWPSRLIMTAGLLTVVAFGAAVIYGVLAIR